MSAYTPLPTDQRADTHGEAVSSSQVILWGFLIRDATLVAYIITAYLDGSLSAALTSKSGVVLTALIGAFVAGTAFVACAYAHYGLLSLPAGTPAGAPHPITPRGRKHLARAAELLLFARDMLAYGHTFAHLPRTLFYLLVVPVFLSTGAVTGQLRFYVIDPSAAALAAAEAEGDGQIALSDEKSPLWRQPATAPRVYAASAHSPV